MLTDLDTILIDRWLHNRSASTQRNYRADVAEVLQFAGKPRADLGIGDLQAYATHLADRGLARATVGRRCAAIKSLLRFGYELGMLSGGRRPAAASAW